MDRKRPAKPQGRRSVEQLKSKETPSSGTSKSKSTSKTPQTDFEDRSLEALSQAGYFNEIVFELRSGKEATVYVLEGRDGPFAVKLYADSRVRSFQDDSVYKEGRQITDHRFQKLRESSKKLGVPLEQALWIAEEFWQLEELYEAGVRVPRPIVHMGRALAMQLIGNAEEAAPRLADVRLSPEMAAFAFEQSVEQLILMLNLGRVHGDYSAFNLLWWEEKVYVIDLPQVIRISQNAAWKSLLERDVQTLCTSFARLGVRKTPEEILERVWAAKKR
jgi:RIO kinase 1